jgi:molybdenum cofactor cytidylyltransferase
MKDGPPDGKANLPVVDPVAPGSGHDRREQTGDPVVAGVLLAAGLGTRFRAGNKLLADHEGEPIVVRAARSLLDAGLPTVAVLGHEAGRVAGALRTLDTDGRLAFVGNPDYRAGQSTSVRAGIRAVCGAAAAAFSLGDMPAVSPDAVRSLVRAYRNGAGDALAAAHEGRRGNPVLFDARHFHALADVEGDRGGRDILLGGDRSALVETRDPGVLWDVDTTTDLAASDDTARHEEQ